MGRKRHEIWALCVLTMALLVLFSILSFNANDRTVFNASSHTPEPLNWVGAFGAHVAWPLLFLFGIGAYGLVFTGLWASRRIFRGLGFEHPWIRFSGIVLLILSVITLAALHWPRMSLFGQQIETGGKIGTALALYLSGRLYAVGSHILLLGIFLIALLLSTPLTLKSVWDRISARLSQLWEKARGLFSRGGGEPEDEEDFDKQTADFPEPKLKKKEKPGSPAVVPEPLIKKQPRREPITQPLTQLSIAEGSQYALPPLSLLDTYETETTKPDWKRLEQNAAVLEEKLADFGVQGKVVGINPGPVITMFEYAPAPGIKISRIVGLADDLSMALKAISVRVVAPIPGKAAIGIEIPNPKRELVSIKAVLEAEIFSASTAPLTMALGKDITGGPVVANLGKMPHLLIAGATGTGKSVCINTILSSLLYRNTPEDLRLLLIDPKRIELKSYEGVPQLIHPVVTDAKMATRALRWAVEEMELRYKLLADKNVRNIESYNRVLAREKPQKTKPAEDPETEVLQHHRLPYLVIVIDELADLMMVASREVEESITRLAQMARAAGIHLILATQRPSVDVLTGIIKANISTRISFQVSSRIDSRTIIDGSGAEALLGSGDMLFLPPGTAKLQRIHGAFISDSEVVRLTDHWKTQQSPEDPILERVDFKDDSAASDVPDEELDDKYDEAVQIVLETRQASISMLQRRLRVGYNRAARMIEVMEQQGIVTPSDGVRPREVLGRRMA
ncbi:MAG: DNA translocase FtsK 4TM domain-containing protein [Syntrophobacteraceae bacterium]